MHVSIYPGQLQGPWEFDGTFMHHEDGRTMLALIQDCFSQHDVTDDVSVDRMTVDMHT